MMGDAGGDSGSAVTSVTTPTPEASQLSMAEIGDELVRDVPHRMRDACEPRQRAGIILTHKP